MTRYHHDPPSPGEIDEAVPPVHRGTDAACVQLQRPLVLCKTRVGEQVLLAPNFKAMVSRSCYADPAQPDCRFVDLTEVTGTFEY